jgi:hypothetical protein
MQTNPWRELKMLNYMVIFGEIFFRSMEYTADKIFRIFRLKYLRENIF